MGWEGDVRDKFENAVQRLRKSTKGTAKWLLAAEDFNAAMRDIHSQPKADWDWFGLDGDVRKEFELDSEDQINLDVPNPDEVDAGKWRKLQKLFGNREVKVMENAKDYALLTKITPWRDTVKIKTYSSIDEAIIEAVIS